MVIAVIAAVLVVQSEEDSIKLASHCPPGFELTDENECKCRNLYQQYESLLNSGVGGLKSALPKVRDGFSPQQIDLGRYLFFDPVLSGDRSLSCSSCHDPNYGFSDGKGRALGMDGATLQRGAPSIWNVAFLQSLFWDARASSLEEQMQGPLYSAEEMGNTPANLVATLNEIPAYKRLFKVAFPAMTEAIRVEDVHTAIAAFESSLISLNSRYDHYAHGYHEALNDEEIEGLNVFRSFVARCAECHTPPLFTNQQVAVLGTPEPDGLPLDPGAEKTYDDPKFRAGFKVPSLRNVAVTAPYMHSGSFATLRETVAFYTKGRGHAVPEDEDLNLHWHIWEPKLSDYELDRLVDFLKTLTDEGFKPKVPDQLPSGLKPGLVVN
ncbi:MAG: cytochrome-c peroxidase [Flavobacteriales bacterium]|nr:MAG: cytochrome-c peroxidase [Flavobacteriales bacterium]